MINKSVFEIEKISNTDERKSEVVDCLHLAAAEEERINRLAFREERELEA